MTHLTLTREQVGAVLLGLCEHSSGTATDHARLEAILTLADAFTASRPIDADLARLRERLVRELAHPGCRTAWSTRPA